MAFTIPAILGLSIRGMSEEDDIGHRGNEGMLSLEVASCFVSLFVRSNLTFSLPRRGTDSVLCCRVP